MLTGLTRIAHITTDYKPIFGGAETYIENLFNALENAGYSQRVYQRDMGIKSKELILVPRLPRFLRIRNRGSEIWAFNAFLLSKLNKLRREDLLLVHYPLQFLPVFWHKCALVLSHGVEWQQPPSSFNHKLKKKVAKFAFNKAKCFVANDSNFFREMGIDLKPKQKMFKEVEKNKWFLPNCVDTDRFSPNQGLEQLKALNPILVPRNISFGRGIHLAIEAFSLFVRKYPKTNLVITGDIVDYVYFGSLLKLVKTLNLSGKVYFLGGIPWDQMPRVYASAQLVIIPTIFSEGTSLSALESMACGVATVSTNAGGLPDLPTKLSKIDFKNLSKVMLDTFEERAQIGALQREVVVQIYNLNKWIIMWKEIIKRTLVR